jgi:hypothetical protein
MSEVTVSGSLLDTMKSAEIIARYEEPWEQFVEDMREDHERIIGPTLADKEENTMFSVGTFEGGLWTSKDGKRSATHSEGIRDGDHLLHCRVLGYDFDGKGADDDHFLTAEEFSRRMQGVLHLTYSTHSSTLYRPKFRAFVAIDRRLVGVRGQEYKDLSRFVAGVKFPAHKFDGASFDATRGFFRPCHNSANMDAAFFHVHDGSPLGVDSWLGEFYRQREVAAAERKAQIIEAPKSRKRKAIPKSRSSAINYCLAVPHVERNTMLNVGCKLLREWGSEIAHDVWREYISSRYISDSRGGSVLTAGEVKSTWAWIEEHTTKREGKLANETTNTPTRPGT